MKKTLATVCLFSATLALSACNTTDKGNIETAPPYAMERTASTKTQMAAPTPVAPAERVFQRAQTK